MPVRFIKPLFLTLLLFVVGLDTWGQSRMPSNTSAFLISANKPTGGDWYGDFDKVQVVFFEIDASVSDPFYVALYDIGWDSAEAIDGNNPGDTWVRVYGGTGAYSDPKSRKVGYTTTVDALSGTKLYDLNITAANMTNAAYNSAWYYTSAFTPSQGELVGNKRIFKLVIVGGRNPDSNTNTDAADDFVNMYQVAVSSNSSGSPVDVTGIRSFAYSLSVGLLGDASTGTQWDLYPFVPNSTLTTDYVMMQGYDVDYRTGNSKATNTGFDFKLYNSSATLMGNIYRGGDNLIRYENDNGTLPATNPTQAAGAYGYQIASAAQQNTTWHFYARGGEENGASEMNGADVWFVADSNGAMSTVSIPLAAYSGIQIDSDAIPLRIYSQPYTPLADAGAKIQTTDGTAKTVSDYETVLISLVDASGNAVPYSRYLQLELSSVSTNARITWVVDKSNPSGTNPNTTSYLIRTDDDGTATVRISKSPAGADVATLNVYGNGVSIPGTNVLEVNYGSGAGVALDTATINFVDTLNPTVSSNSNSAISNLSTTADMAAFTITVPDIGVMPSAGPTNYVWVRIPSSKSSVFDTTRTSITLNSSGVGALSTPNYTTSKILRLTVSGTFAVSDTLRIGSITPTATNNIGITSGTSQENLNLEFSWNSTNGIDGTWVSDDKVVTVSDASNFTWNGSTSTTWTTPANWTPSGPPANSSTISATITNQTNDPTWAVASNQNLRNLTLQAGASLVVTGGTNTLTLAGDLTLGAGSSFTASGFTSIAIAGNLTIGTGASLILGSTTITVSGTIIVAGTITQTTGGISVSSISQGTISTGGGNIVFTSAINLTGDLSVDSGSGSITFNSAATVNNNYGLTLTSTGTKTLDSVIGGSSRLASLTLNGTGIATISKSISLSGNTAIFNTPVVISATSTLSEAVGHISFNDTLTIDPSVTYTLECDDIRFTAGANKVSGTLASSQLIFKPYTNNTNISLGGATGLPLSSTDLDSITASNFLNISFNPTGTGQVLINGTTSLTNLSTFNGSLSASSGTLTANVNISLNGSADFTGGTFQSNAGTISITGDVTRSSGGFNLTGTNTLSFTGSGAQAANLTLSTIQNLTLNNSSGLTLSGNLSLGGNLTISAGTLTLANASGSVTGNVSGAGTLDASAITGANTLSVGGSLGTGTPLSNLSAPNSSALNVGTNWNVTSFTHNNGAVVLNGTNQTLTTNAQTFYDLTINNRAAATTVSFANALNVNGTFTVTGSNAYHLTISNGGTAANSVTFANTGLLTISAGYVFTSGATATAPTKNFTGTISSANSALAFGTTGITLGGNAGFDSGSAITTLGAVTGATFNLSLSGSGADLIASTTNVGTLDTTGMTGGSVTVTGSTGASTITTAAAAYDLIFTGGGTITGVAVSFDNTGYLTIGASMSFAGGVSKTTGIKNLNATISTGSNNNLDFGTAGTVNIKSSTTLDAGTGIINLFDTIIDDGFTLTIGNAKAATINLSAVSGVASGAVSNLTINNTTATATITGNIGTDLGTITLTKTGGSAIFNGSVTATTLTTSASAFAVQLNSGGTITNAVTFNNTGNVTIGSGFTFTGGVTSINAGTNSFAGTVQTGGGAGQNISLDDLSVGAAGLTFDAGALGTISVTGAISGGNALTVTNADQFTVGTTTNLSTLTFSSTISAASLYDFIGNLTTTTLVPNNGTYNLRFRANATITNNVNFQNIGTLQIGDSAGDVFTSNGTFTVTTPTVSLAGTLVTSNDDISIGTATTLLMTSTISTQSSAGIGNILLTGNLNVTSSATDILVLRSGTGTIDYRGAIPTTAPRYIEIQSAGGLTNGVAAVVNLDNVNLFYNAPGSTMSLGKQVNTTNFVAYQGTIDLNGKELRVANDLALYGTGYNANDPDRPAASEFAYPNAGAVLLLAIPGSQSAAISNGLVGAKIKVARNFYANGVNLSAANAWELWLVDKGRIDDLLTGTINGIGSGLTANNDYALAISSSVSNCTVKKWDGSTWTASTGTEYVNAAENPGTVTASSEWITTRPSITSAKTIYDDMVEVIFNMPIENTNNEISLIVNNLTTALNMRMNNGVAADRFLGVFIWNDGGDNIWAAGEAGTFDLLTASAYASTDVPNTIPLYFKTATAAGTYGTTRWNTDATGSSSGSSISTDRSGANQTSIVRLILQKSRIFAANGKTMNANFGDTGAGVFTAIAGGAGYAGGGNAYLAPFTGTTDGTRPVLVGAWAGKANHSAAGATPYNGHNLLHLRYSEPIDLSGLNGAQVAAGGAPINLGDATASGIWPIRSDSGAGFVSGIGSATISGFNLTYTGNYYSGARTYSPIANDESNANKTNLIYRSLVGNTENPAGAPGLTIFMSGYSIGSLGINFPGYLGDPASATNIPTNPVGQTLAQAINASLLDANGNAVEPTVNVYAGKVGGVSGVTILGTATSAITLASVSTGGAGFAGASFTDGWDLVKPSIPSTGGPTKYIYTVVDSVTGKMGEFHIVTVNDANSDDLEDTPLSPDGIRDSSWNFSSGDSPTNSIETAAFQIGNLGSATNNTYNTVAKVASGDAGIATNVNISDAQAWLASASVLGAVNIIDDQYIKLFIDKNTNPYGPLNNMIVSYDATSGFITDWAGNLLSSFTNFEAIERTPPSMNVTLAAVGGKKLFAQFDEPIYHYNGSTFTSVLASDFELYDGATPTQAVKITILKTENTVRGAGATQILVEFANNSLFTASNLYTLNIRGSVDSGSNSFVVDKLANRIQTTTLFRMTDVGLNIITPIYASDSVSNSTFSPNIDPVRVFDGSAGLLGQGTIKIEVGVDSLITPSLPFLMYYGLNVDASFDSTIGSYWSPLTIDGLIKNPYPKAKTVNGAQVGATNKWDFSIGLGTAPKDSSLEFIFELNGLPQGYTPNVDDPTQIRPWGISVGKVIDQRGGVSILNNVINPDVGDKAVLKYSLAKPGQVNIIVFTLDGNIVKVLEKGQKASGDYFLSWDGKNASGKVVARGLYLIRVVGPDFDEYRKVMVVK